MTDIIDRLAISLHVPVPELRAHLREVIPLAIGEIQLLRERRDTLSPATVPSSHRAGRYPAGPWESAR